MKSSGFLGRRAMAVAMLSILIHVGAAGAIWAVPLGFSSQTITFPEDFGGASALAFAPDGTLYVVEAVRFGTGATSTSIHVVLPNGSPGGEIPLVGDSLLPASVRLLCRGQRGH